MIQKTNYSIFFINCSLQIQCLLTFDDESEQQHSAIHGRWKIDRYLHSETCQLSGICKSWRFSHFAASFIEHRAKPSIADRYLKGNNTSNGGSWICNSLFRDLLCFWIREWSCCRFTYSNLVTTFASSRLWVLPSFDSEASCPATKSPKGSTQNPLQATTGGVYKNQGRIRCVLMKRAYKTFLVHGE